jgi:sugar/nucleoside kinase (ribokinase family)
MRENGAPTIVIVGHVAIDTNKFSQGMIESAIGGAPTYAGLALAALRKKVGVVAKIGVDFTELFPPIYSKMGLDTEGILVSGEYTTAFENIYDEKGNRTQLCRHVAPEITPDDIPTSYLEAKGFYVSPLADEVTLETMKKIKGDNLVVMDPQGLFRQIDEKGRVTIRSEVDLKPFLEHVDVVKMGREEAKLIMKEPKQLLEKLCEMGPKIAILTRGEEPALMLSDGEFHEVKSLKVDARDPTGAGDVFGAVFLARYLEVRDAVESAKFASAAAGLKIRYKGPVGFPSESEVHAAIQK